MLTIENIVTQVKEAVVEASTASSPDVLQTLEAAIAAETNEQARWALTNLLENRKVAQDTKFLLCDDTGIPHVLLDIGRDAVLPAGFFGAVEDGVREGLRAAPGRPMAVLGDDIERIEQSAGLSPDSGDVVPAPLLTRAVPGRSVRLAVLMLGGGPEIRGKTEAVFHQRSMEHVMEQVAAWIKDRVAKLGCTPCVPFIGIGRTHYEATGLMLEAMRDCDMSVQSEWEQWLTDAVNETEVGPLNLGGKFTALRSFIRIGPQRASGVRVVCMRLGCSVDPRRSVRVLSGEEGHDGVA